MTIDIEKFDGKLLKNILCSSKINTYIFLISDCLYGSFPMSAQVICKIMVDTYVNYPFGRVLKKCFKILISNISLPSWAHIQSVVENSKLNIIYDKFNYTENIYIKVIGFLMKLILNISTNS